MSMKKWYKICPYCWNEIKEWAIKCQYCKEFLKVEEPKKVEIKEDKTKKKVKKEKVEPKKSKKKQENKINYSSIRWIIRNIFSDFWELFKVIFSAWENRIGLWMGITLYLFWMLLIAGFMCLLALPFWENIFESGENNVFTVLTAVFFIVYLRWYLAPKRAMDHGQPRYVWIIPIVNAFYFLTSWDKWDNQYWEKPSILRTLWGRWYDKKDNKNISKYWAIILLILVIVLCCLLLPTDTKRNTKVNNTTSILDRPSILEESYIKAGYTENETIEAFNKLLGSYHMLARESLDIDSVTDLKDVVTLNGKVENCKLYGEDTEDFLKRYDDFINKYYNTWAISFIKSPVNELKMKLEIFYRLTIIPLIESCKDYYSYLISIQNKFEIDNEWKISFYDQNELDNFNKKVDERFDAEEKYKEQGLKLAENLNAME